MLLVVESIDNKTELSPSIEIHVPENPSIPEFRVLEMERLCSNQILEWVEWSCVCY